MVVQIVGMNCRSQKLADSVNGIYDCERRELPSQYGRPKKRNKIFNIGRRTILYKHFLILFQF